jgi:acyl transferase domain-containing protein
MQNGIPADRVVPTIRHNKQEIADDRFFMQFLGRMWAVGVTIDWDQIWGGVQHQKLPLPGTSFQRARHFIEPGTTQETEVELTRIDAVEDWGTRPVWRPKFADCIMDVESELALLDAQNWLVFIDEVGLGRCVVDRLRDAGQRVIKVSVGD